MQTKRTSSHDFYFEEDKYVANKFIDNDIGSVDKILWTKLPFVAKDLKENSSNVSHKRVVNAQNNQSTDYVIDPSPHPLYSSCNPEPGK